MAVVGDGSGLGRAIAFSSGRDFLVEGRAKVGGCGALTPLLTTGLLEDASRARVIVATDAGSRLAIPGIHLRTPALLLLSGLLEVAVHALALRAPHVARLPR